MNLILLLTVGLVATSQSQKNELIFIPQAHHQQQCKKLGRSINSYEYSYKSYDQHLEEQRQFTEKCGKMIQVYDPKKETSVPVALINEPTQQNLE